MPQVLPYVPSFGEQLAPVLSQTIGNVAQGYQKYRQSQNDQTILQQLQNGQISPLQSQTLWSKLSPEARKINEPFLTSQLRMQEHANKEQLKTQSKVADETREKQEFEPTIKRLEELIPRTGARLPFTKSFLGGVPGTEAFQEREEFDKLGFLAADKVFTHFNKGTVSKEKLNKISEDLAPRAELSERTNKARINALKKIIGLPDDISEKKFDAQVKKITQGIPDDSSAKVEKGTKLTKDVLEKWKNEGLSRDQAEQRAKEQGYEF